MQSLICDTFALPERHWRLTGVAAGVGDGNSSMPSFVIVVASLVVVVLASFITVTCTPASAQADTAAQVIGSIYHRGIYFDGDRFDAAVLLDFINDASYLIGTIGHTNQRCTTFALGSGYSYAMPSDFYAANVAILNADPNSATDEIAVPKVLLYTKSEDYASQWAPDAGRPQSYTVWADTLRLNRPSMSDSDTLTVWYWAEPTPVTAGGDTVDIPDRYLPLLKDVVVQLCVWRVEYPDRPLKDEALALTKVIADALGGQRNE